MEPHVYIDVYSHHVAVQANSHLASRAVNTFIERFAEYAYRRNPRTGGVTHPFLRTFSSQLANKRAVRIHINTYADLLQHLSQCGVAKDAIKIRENPLYTPVEIDFEMAGDKTPTAQQVPIIEHITRTKGSTEPQNDVVTMQTGKGKTYSAVLIASILRVRVAIVIQAMYIEQWCKELVALSNIDPNDIMVVQGSPDMKAVIEMGLRGEITEKFIIISNSTLHNFIEHHVRTNGKSRTYGCLPHQLFEVLGVGMRLIDEVHAMFHRNFILDLYTHCPRTLSLSATLVTKSPKVEEMYNVMFPSKSRVDVGAYDAYISVKALMYGLTKPTPLRWLRKGLGSYSQVDYESSILHNRERLGIYLEMIHHVVFETIIKHHQPRQRMLIFADTVEMCEVICAYLCEQVKQFDTRTFVAKDGIENLLEPDIIVSTLKSAGTGRDIPGLRWTLMTNAVDAPNANLQALGRLRKLKEYPAITPEFYYLVCVGIDKHLQYHQYKLECFKGKVLEHKQFRLRYSL